jgi:hypothetical protein
LTLEKFGIWNLKFGIIKKMLVIRDEQIQHFIAQDEVQLTKVMMETVRSVNPNRVEGYDDKTLEAMVKMAIQRAKLHQLEKAEDIAAFVGIMFEISPNFDEIKDISACLDDTTFSSEMRFQQLWGKVPETKWAEAEATYDAKVWFPDKQ